ncbi:MAG: formylmethanofuran dehydrogenase subunit B [Planctomycetaceae bacterium]
MLHQNVTCTVCGCLCDDLEIRTENDQIVEFKRTCKLADTWFEQQLNAHPEPVLIKGEAATRAAGIERAAEIIASSQAPLIFGLSRSSTPGQRSAIELADRIGAYVDTTASLCHAPSIMAIQQVGEQTCSLGEVKNRADLVIFWGVDPLVTHPRHGERYSIDPVGEFLPNGRQDRTLVVIDEQPGETSKIADHFLQLDGEENFRTIWALRQLIRNQPLDWSDEEKISLDQLTRLAQMMKSCRSGIIFFGLGVSQARLGHLVVEALLELVTDLNEFTRFYARRMRLPGDVTGADSLLCWQTGFPFAVDLTRSYPRFEPQEYSAQSLLERKEVDACVLIGSESILKMSKKAQDYLSEIPTIVLDYPGQKTQFVSEVRFTTGIYGIHYAGTAYRMDEIPLPLHQLVKIKYPADHEVLDDILKRLINMGRSNIH